MGKNSNDFNLYVSVCCNKDIITLNLDKDGYIYWSVNVLYPSLSGKRLKEELKELELKKSERTS